MSWLDQELGNEELSLISEKIKLFLFKLQIGSLLEGNGAAPLL